MARKGKGNFYHAKRSAVAAPATSASTRKYCAPIVGSGDQVFTIGKTKDDDKFKVVKEKLGNTLPPSPRMTQLMLQGLSKFWKSLSATSLLSLIFHSGFSKLRKMMGQLCLRRAQSMNVSPRSTGC